MSGGHFNYDQYKINQIAENIQSELNLQGKLKDKEDLYMREEYYEKYPKDKFYYTYPEDIQEEFKNAIKYLKLSEIYIQRID